jgi:hypothetical protein
MAYDCLRRDRLAIAHHLLFLLLAGILAFEIAVVRSKMDREDILRVARVDVWYGVLAGAIILVGFSRAIFAAKGWAYYSVKSVLLGETRRLRCGGLVTNHAHSRVHPLAKGFIGQSRLSAPSARNPQCQARSLRSARSPPSRTEAC